MFQFAECFTWIECESRYILENCGGGFYIVYSSTSVEPKNLQTHFYDRQTPTLYIPNIKYLRYEMNNVQRTTLEQQQSGVVKFYYIDAAFQRVCRIRLIY